MKTSLDVLRSALAFAQHCVDGGYRDTDGDYVETYYFETVKRDELIPDLQCAIAIEEAKPDASRAAFASAMRRLGHDYCLDLNEDGDYMHADCYGAFDAWQASRKAALEEAAGVCDSAKFMTLNPIMPGAYEKVRILKTSALNLAKQIRSLK